MNGKYKTSAYNWFIEHSDGLLVHNGITGALIRISDSSLTPILLELSDNRNVQSVIAKLSVEQVAKLEDCGLLITNTYDELGYLREIANYNKYSLIDDVSTIVVTNNCNMICSYCYQQGNNASTRISKAVIERIAEIISESCNPTPKIVLYGGEPLLYPNECIEIVRMCSESAEKRGCKLRSYIVTNGTLLSPKLSSELRDAGINKAQITIDGDPSTHNSRRMYRNGSGTYNDIIENIRSSSIPIAIRFNVDCTDTFDSYTTLSKDLDNCDDIELKLTPIIGPSCSASTTSSRKEHIAKILGRYPSRMLGVTSHSMPCPANAMYKYGGGVVTCEGKTQRCWEEVGTDISYGDIYTALNKRTIMKSLKWLELDIFSLNSKCSTCKMLPGCAGGCLVSHFKDDHDCSITETMYKRILLDEYESRRSKER